jgi:predicted dehydrogenase
VAEATRLGSSAVIRLALIGCGYWGPKVLRAAATLAEVDVVGLVDQDRARGEVVRRHFPAASVHASFQELLAATHVDAVVVATNPASHFELASQAIDAGKHVLVEKPLALTAAECRQLGKEAERADVRLMVGHTFRFSPAVDRVRAMIDAGELGTIYYVDCQRLNLGRVRRDVDAIWNFAPHDLSIVDYWLGVPPAAVRCHAYEYLQEDVADVAFLVLEYDEPLVAHVHVSWLSPSKVRRITVVGSERMVVYDDVASAKLTVFDSGIDRRHIGRAFPEFESFGEFQLIEREGDVLLPRLPPVEPLVAECRHFVQSILGGSDPITDWREGLEVVAILEAAAESRREGGERVLVDLDRSSTR